MAADCRECGFHVASPGRREPCSNCGAGWPTWLGLGPLDARKATVGLGALAGFALTVAVVALGVLQDRSIRALFDAQTTLMAFVVGGVGVLIALALLFDNAPGVALVPLGVGAIAAFLVKVLPPEIAAMLDGTGLGALGGWLVARLYLRPGAKRTLRAADAVLAQRLETVGERRAKIAATAANVRKVVADARLAQVTLEALARADTSCARQLEQLHAKTVELRLLRLHNDLERCHATLGAASGASYVRRADASFAARLERAAQLRADCQQAAASTSVAQSGPDQARLRRELSALAEQAQHVRDRLAAREALQVMSGVAPIEAEFLKVPMPDGATTDRSTPTTVDGFLHEFQALQEELDRLEAEQAALAELRQVTG